MNQALIVSTAVITGIGALNAIVNKRPISTVIQGGLVFTGLLALLDALSPSQWGKLSGALASLAAGVCVLVELPAVLKGFGF